MATKVPITEDVEAPRTSTRETIVKLIQNAFLRAILPGFEKEVSGGGKNDKPAADTPDEKPDAEPSKKPAAPRPDLARNPERDPG